VGTKVLHKLNAQTLLLPKLEMTCRVVRAQSLISFSKKAILKAPQKLFLPKKIQFGQRKKRSELTITTACHEEVGTGNGNVGDNIPMHIALLVPKTPTNPFS
jgi:hypothetical protein